MNNYFKQDVKEIIEDKTVEIIGLIEPFISQLNIEDKKNLYKEILNKSNQLADNLIWYLFGELFNLDEVYNDIRK